MTEFPSSEDPQRDSLADPGNIAESVNDKNDEFAATTETTSTTENLEPADIDAASATADAQTTDELAETAEATSLPAAADSSPPPQTAATSEGQFSEAQLLGAADPLNRPSEAAAGAGPEPAGPASSEAGSGNQPPPPQPPPGYAPPPPGYGAQPGVRRIFRSRHDRKLGGVSAGIAEFLRVDPTLVRVVTLLFALSGIGVLIYFVAWIIIPLRPEGFVDAPRPAATGNERTMTLALGVAALALAFGIVTGSWAVLALALVGGGVWLLSEQTSPTAAFAAGAPAAAYPPPAAPAASGLYEPTQYAAPATPSAAAYPPPTNQSLAPPYIPPAAVAPRERKPQRITWVVLSLLALLTAVGLAAATGDWWDVSATRFLGIGVIIIGVGVVVGQIRRGGARGLIPLGILAALALFPVSAVDGLIDDGVGDTTYRPASIAELEDTYQHGVGVLTVDLSNVDFTGQNETVDIDLGIGELIVIVSEDTGGEAILQVTAGEVSHMLPQSNSVMFDEGVNIESGTILLAGDDGTLDLNINVGLGTAELRSERS